MLSELIKNGFGEKEDLNCAEKILWGANTAYNLGLDKEALKLASGFGGGMAIQDKCGALTAAIMVLGKLFVKERAHESEKIKELTIELFDEYNREMSSIDCKPLKEMYRTEELKCSNVILKAAEILDTIVMRELK
ncbi:MAG: C-GCAxxG-C-C family (seleno)protein [Tissierellia bacterium]|nr:C-GCAxxG-C-C family (seleno)protein [Tissierellia bacterium]MDD3751453.1 C-GCAxxG-C-C family (seleno)protein [Tissierellia bacterium]MDD4046757.1 C-GCAxxG-C-C family (seleno)protein [Tissierellia bacterium]MDD4678798.1 C-GCAxxG-C-C family (seleno)protein [Tissierellia bacterium]